MTVRLQSGDIAPEFTLSDQDGNEIRLADYRGKRVILYFYPAAATPGCTREACDFRDSLAALSAAGLTVLGISRDPIAKIKKFHSDENLTFPLLSDPDHVVQDAYGAWGSKINYGKLLTGSIRSTFVINADGRIENSYYNVRATGHVARLRREHGVDL